ncbi:MAG: hypothetical protein R2861_07800 [Desulfobacterales bacterium]
MPHRLEITLKPDLFDAEGQGICTQAADYFDIHIDAIRTRQVITMWMRPFPGSSWKPSGLKFSPIR